MTNTLFKKGLVSLAAASVLASGAYAGGTLADLDVKLSYEKSNYAVTGDASRGIVLTISALDEDGQPATTYANGTLISSNPSAMGVSSSLAAATSATLACNTVGYGDIGTITGATNTNLSSGRVQFNSISADGRARFSMDYDKLVGFGDESLTVTLPGGISKTVNVNLQPNLADSYITRVDSSIDIDPKVDNNRILSDLKSTNRDLTKPIPHSIKGVKTVGDSVTITVLAIDNNGTDNKFTSYTPDSTRTVYALYRDSSAGTFEILDKQDIEIVDGQGKATFTITKGDDNRSMTGSALHNSGNYSEVEGYGAANIVFSANFVPCGPNEIGAVFAASDITPYLNSNDDNITYIAKPVSNIVSVSGDYIGTKWNELNASLVRGYESNVTIKFVDEYGNKVIPTSDDLIDVRFESYESNEEPEDGVDYNITRINGVSLENTSITTQKDQIISSMSAKFDTDGDFNYTYNAVFISTNDSTPTISIAPNKADSAEDIDDVKLAITLISGGEVKTTLLPTIKAGDVNGSSTENITSEDYNGKYLFHTAFLKDTSSVLSSDENITVGSPVKITITMVDVDGNTTVGTTTGEDNEDDYAFFEPEKSFLSLNFASEGLLISEKGKTLDDASTSLDINLTRTVAEVENEDRVTYTGYFIPWTASPAYELSNMKFLGAFPLDQSYLLNNNEYSSTKGQLAVSSNFNISIETTGKTSNIYICDLNNNVDMNDTDGDGLIEGVSGIGTSNVTVNETMLTGGVYDTTVGYKLFNDTNALAFYDIGGNKIETAISDFTNNSLTSEVNGASLIRNDDLNITFASSAGGSTSILNLEKDDGVATITFPHIQTIGSASKFTLALLDTAGESVRRANTEQIFYVGLNGTPGNDYNYTILITGQPENANVKIYDTDDKSDLTAADGSTFSNATNALTVSNIVPAKPQFLSTDTYKAKRYFAIYSSQAGDVKIKVVNQDAYTTAPEMQDSDELTITFANSEYEALSSSTSTISVGQGQSVTATISGGDATKYSVTASDGLNAEIDENGIVTITSDASYDLDVIGSVTITDTISTTTITVTVTEVKLAVDTPTVDMYAGSDTVVNISNAAGTVTATSDNENVTVAVDGDVLTISASEDITEEITATITLEDESGDTATVTATVEPVTTLSGSVDVVTGWNIVTSPVNGTVSNQAMLDVAAESASGSGAKVVWVYDLATGGYKDMGSVQDVTPGQGVWVKSASDSTIEFNDVEAAGSDFDLASVYSSAATVEGTDWKLIGVSENTTVSDVLNAGASIIWSYAGAWAGYDAGYAGTEGFDADGYYGNLTADTVLKAGTGFWAE